MKKLISFVFIFFVSSQCFAATYYVRTDGSTATNCTGLTDAAYPGSGTGQDCAFNHPHWVMPNIGVGNDHTHDLASGDTVIIGDPEGGSEFRMGCQNDVTCRDALYNQVHSATCATSYPYDCGMGALASGDDANNMIKIYGRGWDTGCENPPVLYAQGVTAGDDRGATTILNLNGSDNVDVRCLDITDKINGNGAINGIAASASDNVIIKDVDIHGLHRGIFAGGLSDWTMTNLKLRMNHSAGWDGDIGHSGQSYNTGTITFINPEITYNGCAEDISTGLQTDCCSQNNGCYGDGLGTYLTGGAWIFENANISHNTSDGLDLLYADETTSVRIKNSLFEGNGGQQLKIPSDSEVINSFMLGNCGYFHEQTFTRTAEDNAGYAFPDCRALGNVVVISYKDATDIPKIVNSTILSNGDVGIQTGGECSTGHVVTENSILLGGRQFNDDTAYNGAGGNDTSSIFYNAGTDGDGTGCNTSWAESNNICYGFKEGSNSCNGTNSTDTVNPLFIGDPILMGPDAVGYFQEDNLIDSVYLSSSSPAIGAGNTEVTCYDDCSVDYDSCDRGLSWDIGAVEYGCLLSSASCTFSGGLSISNLTLE